MTKSSYKTGDMVLFHMQTKRAKKPVWIRGTIRAISKDGNEYRVDDGHPDIDMAKDWVGSGFTKSAWVESWALRPWGTK